MRRGCYEYEEVRLQTDDDSPFYNDCKHVDGFEKPGLYNDDASVYME